MSYHHSDEDWRRQPMYTTYFFASAKLGSINSDEEAFDTALFGMLHDPLGLFTVLIHVAWVMVKSDNTVAEK
jgi:hypothetical protein